MNRPFFATVWRRGKYWIIAAVVVFTLFLLCPPAHFDEPYSTLLLDRNGELLAARVSDDGQWRFPVPGKLPEKYVKAVLCFEDRYFVLHPGINPVAVVRALIQDIRAGKIVSGGSTLTMQVARLSRHNPPRNVWEKLVEAVIALRTELTLRKATILRIYASHAPMGSNVVGIEAASWRYFGVPPSRLSWAEAATLAVLPNAPTLIYPGRNQEKLLIKRNALLSRMYNQKIIDRETYELAVSEPVPGEPYPLPRIAPHLLDRAIREGFKGRRIRSTLDEALQEKVNEVVNRYYELLSYNHVRNAAALVMDTRTGEILAYTGNTEVKGEQEGGDVDMIQARRNYGSLLKPFLYASMLNEGLLLPDMLVSDVPVSFQGYSPSNFQKTFEGMVPASEALARSLNVPHVILLRQYGIEKFNAVLKDLGMTTLVYPPDHYGLSIILGGAEGTLWELTSMFAAMGNRLLPGSGDSLFVAYQQEDRSTGSCFPTRRFMPSAAWFALQAITAVRRPDENGTLKYFSTSRRVGWKTGTSYGSRDAWAIGVTPEYTVGVWVGNASGEGRPGLTGVTCAAPVMFDIFNLLPPTTWFREPVEDMVTARICVKSGHIAGPDCPVTENRKIMAVASLTRPCPYHRLIHLDPNRSYQVTDKCFPPSRMVTEKWFVLPLVQEWFYRQNHSDYRPLPPFGPGCRDELSAQNPIGLIYPYPGTRIYLPVRGDQQRCTSIWKATHRSPGATIYWHLDEVYLGKTTGTHALEVTASPGIHRLTLVDDNGETLTVTVEIVGEKK
jgi:penicillin-binding protein 1C